MRTAPVAIAAQHPFRLGCEVGVLTHGHPSGYLSAAACSVILAALLQGDNLDAGIERALTTLKSQPGHDETTSGIEQAGDAATNVGRSGRKPGPNDVEALGEGWTGEEALGIALFCALVATDFTSGVVLAVNHSGDSDSTGAITGNLLGAMLGRTAIPDRFLRDLEAREVIEKVADDLVRHFITPPPADDWDRYPGA